MTIIDTLGRLITDLGTLGYELITLGGHYILLIAWIAWWLWGVNWSRGWAFLARGAWAPLVLLMIVTALVWSRIAPGTCDCLGFMRIPNFWWQLGYVGMLVAIMLFCGWVQGVFHWAPAEISLEPPAHTDAGHGHEGHGHDHAANVHAAAHDHEPHH